jgi:hypothetical protein
MSCLIVRQLSVCALIHDIQVEEGTHEELMSIDLIEDTEAKTVQAGHYHKMWDTQVGTAS